MMKRIIGLALVCGVLFVGCKHNKGSEVNKTQFTLKNECPLTIGNIKYCGEELYEKRVYIPSGYCGIIDSGKEAVATFESEKTGYVFFSLFKKLEGSYSFAGPGELRAIEVAFNVRTNEAITISKGEETVFSITDNTLVVVSGESQPVKIVDLIRP